MFRCTRIKFFTVIASACLLSDLCGAAADPNVALHKKVTLSLSPEYGATSKDPAKLVDGIVTPDSYPTLWVDDKYALGWHSGNVDVVVDLEESKNISGTSFRTMAGVSEVAWPESILVFSSDDLKSFAYLGNLCSPNHDNVPVDGKALTYKADNLSGRGRYVMFKVSGRSGYLFCDEITVHEGGEGIKKPSIGADEINSFIAGLFVPEMKRNGRNIAENIEVKFITGPGSPQKNETRKLTDGKFAPGKSLGNALEYAVSYFGWSPFQFEVDLGEVRSIGGIALSSQIDGKSPLDAVFVCGSLDNQKWYVIADIAAANDWINQEDGRNIYSDLSIKNKARYLRVALIARSLPMTYFFDEFEVYEGDPAILKQQVDNEATDKYQTLLNDALTGTGARKRLRSDFTTLTDKIGKDGVFSAELGVLKKEIDAFQLPKTAGFSSVFPQNDIQRQIYRLFAEYLRKNQYPSLSLWSNYRYHYTTSFDLPKNDFKGFEFKVLRNESLGGVLSMLNSSNKEMVVDFKISGDKKMIDNLEFSLLPWTDTAEGIGVSTILIPQKMTDGRFSVVLPSGLSQRIYVTVFGDNMPAGKYPLQLSVNDRTYPFAVEVSPVKLNSPRLLVGSWDYTDSMPALALTEKNVAAAIKMMDKMHINVPWAGGGLYFPTEADFNDKGDFIGNLHTEKLEKWFESRPDKPVYCIFVNTEAKNRNGIGGYQFGTSEFEVRAKNWIKAFDRRMVELGHRPGQVQWLLVDEVWDDHKASIQTAWSKAFQAAKPMVLRNWNNPVINAKEERFQEMIELIDSLCSGRDLQYVEKDREFYLAQQAKGKNWWTYSCNGPSRLFDPFSYYKLHGLGSWMDQITGIGIWSFGDMGAATAWNEYLLSWAIFSPAAIDENTVYSTLALEAFREGIENSEMVWMLEDRLPEMSPENRQKATELLEQLRQYIVKNTNIHIKWFDAAGKLDREKADDFRLKVIEMLESNNK